MKFRQAGAWVAVSALIAAAIAAGLVNPTPLTCNLNATTANFASQLATSVNGQTICLASGNYGAFAGTNKTVTIAAAEGATPQMTVSFGTGDSGFTLQGMTGMGGSITGTASNITIKNSTFPTPLVIDGPTNSNILLTNNIHDGDGYIVPDQGTPAYVHLPYANGTPHSGVTIQNSIFRDGDADGIQSGVGVNILNNEFYNLIDRDCVWPSSRDCNHTDTMQLIGADASVVDGNYVHDNSDGIVNFPGVSTSLTITDNACDDLARTACVVLYSDNGSTVEHNTAADGTVLEVDLYQTATTGLVVRNNVGALDINSGQTLATNTNNLFSGASSPNINGTPTFVGGGSPTTWAGLKLAGGSAGKNAATGGGDVGIR
jgi:hypothetical protein